MRDLAAHQKIREGVIRPDTTYPAFSKEKGREGFIMISLFFFSSIFLLV